jgi:hypothetical protein
VRPHEKSLAEIIRRATLSTSKRATLRNTKPNDTMNATATSPAAIVRELQSAPANETAQVDLATVGTATIAACKNPYRSGFAVTVISGGNRYGVGGFKATPSKSELAAAINNARVYIAKHSL